MTSRLDEHYPVLASMLMRFDLSARRHIAERVALEALSRTGVEVPDIQATDLESWAERLDGVGWGIDENGEPLQSARAFSRARASFAYRDAALAGESDEAVADSLYEAAAAIGPEVVMEFLGEV